MSHATPVQTGPESSNLPKPRDTLQDRVAAAIVDAAGRVMAERGDAASMSDVAGEAGIARATLYRYFGSRQALEDAVVTRAVRLAHDGLHAGRIGELAARDGVTRAVRALLDVGDPLVVVMRRRAAAPVPEFDRRVAAPIRNLIHEAQSRGELRGDAPAAWLTESLLSVVATAVSSPPAAGREDTVAAVTGVFLDGAVATTTMPRPEGRRATPGGHDG